MRIYSWNINGLRAAIKKGFFDWLEACDGDIVALQETRVLEEQLDDDAKAREGWHFSVSAAERKGYSGVGIYSRTLHDEMQTSLGKDEFDVEGRIQMAQFGALKIVNGYFPNGSGKDRDNGRIPYKLNFYRRLFELLDDAKEKGEPILVLGDFNTAHKDIDLARPKANRKTSGFCPEECAELDRWMENGWTDAFRHLNGDVEGAYSWWSQRFGVRAKNVGWRIDYVLASKGALQFLKAAAIHPDVMGSDHCPISVDLDEAVLKAFAS
ncbi:MAG: exodeoxyribonuclease III [Deltaproteobacteria bacterium]|nr:exodeoxyribonuclease III [Deltaproteobacteria bacterium]